MKIHIKHYIQGFSLFTSEQDSTQTGMKSDACLKVVNLVYRWSTHVTHPAEKARDSLRLFDVFNEIKSRSGQRRSVHSARLHLCVYYTKHTKHTLTHTTAETQLTDTRLFPERVMSDSRRNDSFEQVLLMVSVESFGKALDSINFKNVICVTSSKFC